MNKLTRQYLALCVLGFSFFFTGASQAYDRHSDPHADLSYLD